MGKNELIKSARKITRTSENSLKEYMKFRQLLIPLMDIEILSRKDVLELIGDPKNIKAVTDINTYHVNFIASILQLPDSETLVDSSLWVFRAYMSRGFISKYWTVQIRTILQLLREKISENAFLEIKSIYNWLSVNIPTFTLLADKKIKKPNHILQLDFEVIKVFNSNSL